MEIYFLHLERQRKVSPFYTFAASLVILILNNQCTICGLSCGGGPGPRHLQSEWETYFLYLGFIKKECFIFLSALCIDWNVHVAFLLHFYLFHGLCWLICKRYFNLAFLDKWHLVTTCSHFYVLLGLVS